MVSGAALIAAGAAALAGAVVLAPTRRLTAVDWADRTGQAVLPGRAGGPSAGLRWTLAGVGLAGVVIAPQSAVVVGVLVALGVAVVHVLARRRRDREIEATAQWVIEACDQLAAELASGRPPSQALVRLAQGSALLGPVAEAERVGLDVPHAFRVASLTPGAEALREVAAAWQVAERCGGSLAQAVDQVSITLRESISTRRVVDAELASARATARLVAALPVAALAMGSGVGGDPWHFLLATPVGTGCALAGVGLGLIGIAWIDAIARGVRRG